MAYEPEKPKKTEEQLEDELQSKLNGLETDDTEDTDDEVLDEDPPQKPADKTEEDDDSTPDDSSADDDDSDDDPTPAKDSGDETTDKGVEIPDAHIRAAIHQGWTEDDVKELVAMDPDKAKKVLSKLHETTNRITGEFARLGRAESDRQKAEAKKDEPAPVDLTALKKKYGDDDPLVKIVEQQQKVLQDISTAKEAESRVSHANSQASADEAAKQQVGSFFSRNEMKSYVDFYGAGNDSRKLTQEQYENRFKMLSMADDILLGAQVQGRKMDVAEALEAAHLLATKDLQEQVIRKKIADSVVKRSKGLSLKPKSNKKSTEPKKPSNEDELLSRTAERLQVLQG